MLTEIRADGRAISFFGDLHPSFSGNVVKAMASAKQGYPIVSRMLSKVARRVGATRRRVLRASRCANCARRVERVERLTPTIVEVVVQAPAAARRFEPGQFYRLQNYEALAPRVDGTRLDDGRARADRRMGRSRARPRLDDRARNGRLVGSVRDADAGRAGRADGPTGTPTEIEAGETVVLAGGGLGNAVLFSIGQAFRRAGSKVLYFAGYKRMIDRYKVAEIEAAADVVVWCCDEAPGFAPERPQDRAFVGNIVQAMVRLCVGRSGRAGDSVHRVRPHHRHRLGRMMAAVGAARHNVLAPYLKPRSQGDRLDQLADAMHDEGDLRAVPAAAHGSGHRQDDVRVLVLQPGPAARRRSTFPGSRRGCRRTPCRKS